MKLGPKKKLSDQVASLLKKEIETRDWKELPSYRELCSDLEISQYTLDRALSALTRDGILEPPRPRCRRRVLHAESKRSGKRELCVLSLDPIHRQTSETRIIIRKVSSSLARLNWDVSYLTTTSFQSKNPSRSLNKLLAVHSNATWLLINAPEPAVRWADQKKLDCVLLGGIAFKTDLPCVTTSRVRKLEQVIDSFSKCGRERFVFPVDMNLLDSGSPLVDGVAEIFKRHGLAFSPSYNLPRVEISKPEGFHLALETLFKVTPPGVLILESPLALMMAHSICLEKKLSTKLVYLGEDSIFEWMRPIPSYLKLPVAQFASTLKRWLELAPEQRPPGMKILDTELVVGGKA